jgi:hypothetical protein
MRQMDVERKTRTRFVWVNLAWTTLVVIVAAIVVALAASFLDWTETWVYALLGLLAGSAIGVIRDRRVFQGALGAAGLLVLGFALYWSSGGAGLSEQSVLALLGSAGFAFITTFTLTRIWGRARPAPAVTTDELDEAVAHPHMG